jgi:hypothetical protein
MDASYIGGGLVDGLVADSSLLFQERGFLANSRPSVYRVGGVGELTKPGNKDNTLCSPTVEDKLISAIQRIIITAVIFFAILTWFEFLRTLYDAIFNITSDDHYPGIVAKRFAYAVFITAIAIVVVYIIYRTTTE